MQLTAHPVSSQRDILFWKISSADVVCFSFVVEDDNFNYISARFPGDVVQMAEKLVKLVQKS